MASSIIVKQLCIVIVVLHCLYLSAAKNMQKWLIPICIISHWMAVVKYAHIENLIKPVFCFRPCSPETAGGIIISLVVVLFMALIKYWVNR